MKQIPGIQSVERGLEIMQHLAHTPRMTASALAQKIGIHQSSASRILQSLVKAGFVKKPDFHSFALDFGILHFAGLAMEQFPETSTAAQICNTIHAETGLGAAAAILINGRLLKLAQITAHGNASLKLLDDSDFPLHKSPLGLILGRSEGKKNMREYLTSSIKRTADNQSESASDLIALTENHISANAILYMNNFHGHRFIASIIAPSPQQNIALAIYSPDEKLPLSKAEEILLQYRDVFSG